MEVVKSEHETACRCGSVPTYHLSKGNDEPASFSGNGFCAPWGEPGVQSSDQNLPFFLSFFLNVVLPPDDNSPDEDSDEDALAL